MAKGGNGGFVIQAFPKMMNTKPGKKSQVLPKGMLRKRSRYGSVDIIGTEELAMFYVSEKKKEFR